MNKPIILTYNFVMLAGVAFLAPFVVLYYQSLGYSGLQIGILTGISPLITFISTPILTSYADAKQRHRLVLTVSLVTLATVNFIFPMVSDFSLILLLIIILNILYAPASPIADSATLYMLADEPELYSRMRVAGTIGFAIAITIAGFLVEQYGLIASFWGCSLLVILAMLVTQKFQYDPTKIKRSAKTELQAILSDRYWIRFLAIAFLAGVSLSISINYFFPYLEALGASSSTMGFSLSISAIVEIPVLFFGNRILKRLGAYRLFLIAMFLTAIRLIILGLIDTPTLALVVQALSGLTFPIAWIAGVAYAHDYAPEGMSATGQGLFSAMIFGIGGAVGGLTGGILLDFGTHNLFLISGGTIFVLLILLSLMKERPQTTLEPAFSQPIEP